MSWLEESREYRDYAYYKYRIYENKNHLINKLNMSEDEKAFVRNFFAKYPNYENKIDWNNKNLDFADFKELMNQLSNDNDYAKIPSFKDLKKDVDYKILKITNDYILYRILTYKGAVTIASNKVNPQTASELPFWYKPKTNDPNNDYQKVGKNLWSGAKWCIAMNHTDYYWNTYTGNGDRFYVLCTEDEKYCIQKNNIELDRNRAWDSADNDTRIAYTPYYKEYKELLEDDSGGSNTEKDAILDKYGEDAIEAYEYLFGDIISLNEFESRYIGHFDTTYDFYAYKFGNEDISITSAFKLIDLRGLALEFLEERMNDIGKEEFYREYGNDGVIVRDEDGHMIDPKDVDWDNCTLQFNYMRGLPTIAEEYIMSKLNSMTNFNEMREDPLISTYLNFNKVESYFNYNFEIYNNYFFNA